MSLRQLSVLIFALALVPLAGMAGPPGPPTRIVGQYFLSDDDLDLAGGAVLYSDCSHDGSIVAAIPAGPPSAPRIVAKLMATDWVNDPNPDLFPYALWPVPEALEDMPRLFLCYDVEQISGPVPPFPFDEFCDWAPRDLREPLAVDFDGDEIRDLLISVIYRGGPPLCADR